MKVSYTLLLMVTCLALASTNGQSTDGTVCAGADGCRDPATGCVQFTLAQNETIWDVTDRVQDWFSNATWADLCVANQLRTYDLCIIPKISPLKWGCSSFNATAIASTTRTLLNQTAQALNASISIVRDDLEGVVFDVLADLGVSETSFYQAVSAFRKNGTVDAEIASGKYGLNIPLVRCIVSARCPPTAAIAG